MTTALRRRSLEADALAPARRSRQFRPSARSRIRIATGGLLAIGAIAVMLLIFSTADDRVAVLQLVRDVPAGEQVTAGHVRAIEVSADPTLAVVRSSDLALVVGRYAKVRMVAGSLLTQPMLQSDPLVTSGSAVVAVTIPTGELPAGLRERSQVQIVFPALANQPGAVPPVPVVGRVIGLPTSPDAVTGELSLSVEVSRADAITVAQAAEVRLVLLDPGVDPASAVAATTSPVFGPDPSAGG